MNCSQVRVVAGQGPVLTRACRVEAVRQRQSYVVAMYCADGEWEQSLLPVQWVQSTFGTIAPWWGRDFQYDSAHLTKVLEYPDHASTQEEYLDFTSIPGLTPHVPVPSELLNAVMPTAMGLQYEPDQQSSVMANTVCQKVAAHLKDMPELARHAADVSMSVYALAAYESVRVKKQAQAALDEAFGRLGSDGKRKQTPN